jgi:hypothetical protein
VHTQFPEALLLLGLGIAFMVLPPPLWLLTVMLGRAEPPQECITRHLAESRPFAGLTIADWGPKAAVSAKVVEYMRTVRTSNAYTLRLPHTTTDKKYCLQLLGINIRGLHTHGADVHHHATQRGAKVMLLYETHWCDARDTSVLPMDWTWCFAHAISKTMTSARGGVAIAIHNTTATQAKTHTSHITHGYQIAACAFDSTWTFVALYRDPTGSVVHLLGDVTSFLATTCAHAMYYMATP